MGPPTLTFRIASEEWEFEQIHRLNYATFVEEIPQHPPNPQRRLVDRFHADNTYVIAVHGDRLVGMAAVRDKRPFSLDAKLANLDAYLPPHRSPCELRLLAVRREYRHPGVFRGLMLTIAELWDRQRYDLAVMSGTTRQLKLYEQLGFAPFGPLVGTADARFQPMYLTRQAYEGLRARSQAWRDAGARPAPAGAPVNLLPGPVAISAVVREALARRPVSHRSRDFMDLFADTQCHLCRLVGARAAAIFTGSGTLANDVIAGQLSLLHRPGLILANGEFGNRLIDHAARFGLSFRVLRADWGQPFAPGDLSHLVADPAEIGWVWAVHCETSSGVLNDLAGLTGLCAAAGVHLCVDCNSSIGTVPVDLRDVYLASGVSGKGLGAFAGLAVVFYNHDLPSAMPTLPRYLDLGMYAAHGGVPFTMSSNLLDALHTALVHRRSSRYEEIRARSCSLRADLSRAGLRLVVPEEHASPAVITIGLPETVSSVRVGDELHAAGYLIGYRSAYLAERNWIQICLMGEADQAPLQPLVEALARGCRTCWPRTATRSPYSYAHAADRRDGG